MNPPKPIQATPSSPEKKTTTTANPAEVGPLICAGLVLALCFGQSLFRLVGFSLHSDLYSHIILVPFISLYLIWINRAAPTPASVPDRRIAGCFFVAGGLLLAAAVGAASAGLQLTADDDLAVRVLSFLFFLTGLCAWFLGRRQLRALAFPLAFLLFMVPFPTALRGGLETFLQYGSADAAQALFRLSGTTVFHHDLMFGLPGINLEVAPECSGIRSSLALFITSLLAGHFFLRTPWKRAVLTLAVIPLAILRNGFRIFTIGELCVHISPDMINSYIHRQGGPVFFVLSLVPFFLLLRVLFKSEPPEKISQPTPLPP